LNPDPNDKVEEGAIMKILDHHFVVAIATDGFVSHGTELMGVSVQAPLLHSIEGKSGGDAFAFNGRCLVVDLVK
jgi:hypothetical protein